MPKLRREYTLRVLKNAETMFPNLYSDEYNYSQIFITHFFRFPIISKFLVTHF